MPTSQGTENSNISHNCKGAVGSRSRSS